MASAGFLADFFLSRSRCQHLLTSPNRLRASVFIYASTTRFAGCRESAGRVPSIERKRKRRRSTMRSSMSLFCFLSSQRRSQVCNLSDEKYSRIRRSASISENRSNRSSSCLCGSCRTMRSFVFRFTPRLYRDDGAQSPKEKPESDQSHSPRPRLRCPPRAAREQKEHARDNEAKQMN
jgi:hypothetical protein